MDRDSEPRDALPTVFGRRPYEIEARDYYPIDMVGDAGEAVDPRRILESLWRWKWWIAACTVVGILAGAFGSRFVQPEYEISSSVWLEQSGGEDSGPVRGGEVLAGEGWSSVMTSNAVLRPVVLDLGLYLRPRAITRADSLVFSDFAISDSVISGSYTLEVGADGTYALTVAASDVSAKETGRVGGPVGESFGLEWSPPRSSFESGARLEFDVSSIRGSASALRRNLEVDFDDAAGIIYSVLTWNDPYDGALILNTLQDRFIATATDLETAQLRETVGILRQQTRYAEERLRNSELALENYRVATITLPSDGLNLPSSGGQGLVGSSPVVTRDPVFDAYFNRKVEQRELAAELQTLDRILGDARSGRGIDVLGLQTLSSAGRYPALQSALEELNVKEARRRTLLLTFTEQQEEVQAIGAEIDQLKGATIPALLDDLVVQLQTRLSALETQLESQTSELRSIPTRSIEQARLERELLGAAALHENLQARLKEAELAEATSSPGLQVLDRATPPLLPKSDPKLQILLMASMAGLGIGIAGALLFGKLDKRIRYPDQVSRSLGLPVLGIVPRLDGKAGMEAELAVEAFRSIRVQISHANGGSHGTVLVTSPAPRDGKSMVSANLAISYATAGLRTVLLDADVRRGHAQEMFGTSRTPGLTEHLLGRSDLEAVLQKTSVDNLWMIARGENRGFSAERLDSADMDALVKTLRQEFDVVVLDAPPLAAGADALVLGRQSDKVVIVLRAGETDSELARTKLALIGNVDFPIVGAVLNAVPSSAHYYQYYANYYYADAETVA